MKALYLIPLIFLAIQAAAQKRISPHSGYFGVSAMNKPKEAPLLIGPLKKIDVGLDTILITGNVQHKIDDAIVIKPCEPEVIYRFKTYNCFIGRIMNGHEVYRVIVNPSINLYCVSKQTAERFIYSEAVTHLPFCYKKHKDWLGNVLPHRHAEHLKL